MELHASQFFLIMLLAFHDISRLSNNLKVQYRVLKSRILVLVFSQTNSGHTPEYLKHERKHLLLVL
jgi:hypothetical protein